MLNDLISRADALTEVEIIADGYWHHEVIRKAHKLLIQNIKAIPAVEVADIPCKICEACNTQFSSEPCEPAECLILKILGGMDERLDREQQH